MSLYRIKATCPNHMWKHIATCEIGISPGNPAHEGEKLASILEWAQQKFPQSILTLSDTMYRHNFMAMGMHEQEAKEAGQKLGDDWLSRNNKIFTQYQDKIRIYRWSEWQQHGAFDHIYDDLMLYISSSEPLRQALNTDIQTFIARKTRQGQDIDLAKARMHSFNLITEEIACYILIGRHYKLARAYPSHDMESFAFLRRPETPAQLKGFENIIHVELTLNRRNIHLPQAA